MLASIFDKIRNEATSFPEMPQAENILSSGDGEKVDQAKEHIFIHLY